MGHDYLNRRRIRKHIASVLCGTFFILSLTGFGAIAKAEPIELAPMGNWEVNAVEGRSAVPLFCALSRAYESGLKLSISRNPFNVMNMTLDFPYEAVVDGAFLGFEDQPDQILSVEKISSTTIGFELSDDETLYNALSVAAQLIVHNEEVLFFIKLDDLSLSALDECLNGIEQQQIADLQKKDEKKEADKASLVKSLFGKDRIKEEENEEESEEIVFEKSTAQLEAELYQDSEELAKLIDDYSKENPVLLNALVGAVTAGGSEKDVNAETLAEEGELLESLTEKISLLEKEKEMLRQKLTEVREDKLSTIRDKMTVLSAKKLYNDKVETLSRKVKLLEEENKKLSGQKTSEEVFVEIQKQIEALHEENRVLKRQVKVADIKYEKQKSTIEHLREKAVNLFRENKILYGRIGKKKENEEIDTFVNDIQQEIQKSFVTDFMSKLPVFSDEKPTLEMDTNFLSAIGQSFKKPEEEKAEAVEKTLGKGVLEALGQFGDFSKQQAASPATPVSEDIPLVESKPDSAAEEPVVEATEVQAEEDVVPEPEAEVGNNPDTGADTATAAEESQADVTVEEPVVEEEPVAAEDVQESSDEAVQEDISAEETPAVAEEVQEPVSADQVNEEPVSAEPIVEAPSIEDIMEDSEPAVVEEEPVSTDETVVPESDEDALVEPQPSEPMPAEEPEVLEPEPQEPAEPHQDTSFMDAPDLERLEMEALSEDENEKE